MKVVKIRGLWKSENAKFEDLKKAFPDLTISEFEKVFNKKVEKIEKVEKSDKPIKNEKIKNSSNNKKHSDNSVSKIDGD